MTANTDDAPKLQLSTRGLKLRTAQFDARAAELYGELSWGWVTNVAKNLGVDKASLSLYRGGRRAPSRRFVEIVLKTFGGDFGDYFTYDETSS